MLILNLNGKKYKFLSKQSEITVKIGKDIEELTKEYKCTCLPEFQKHVLCILCGCSLEEALLVDETQLARLIGVHPFFANNIKAVFQPVIKYKNKYLKYMDLSNPMTVEDYGNLDFMAINDYLDDLVLTLYQPIKVGYLKRWFKYRKLKNCQSIDDINYFQHKLSLHYYYEQKAELLREYGMSVEDDGIPKEDKPDDYILTDLEKYGLYHLILEVCDDDYDKQERWLKRDIRELFKFVKYMNKKTVIRNREIHQGNI